MFRHHFCQFSLLKVILSLSQPENHSLLSKNLLDFTIPDHDTPQPMLKGKIMLQKWGVIWGDLFPLSVVIFSTSVLSTYIVVLG